ncbi:MAG: 50S ribosomal protein L35 [Phycisphaerae bacterium]|nr:50S ribosomal protein L35 [Phycisphaerae bacterium]
MPKPKTHKGLRKRFSLTAKGKVRFKKPGTGHLMSHKSGDRCRKLRRPGILKGALQNRIRRMLGAEGPAPCSNE